MIKRITFLGAGLILVAIFGLPGLVFGFQPVQPTPEPFLPYSRSGVPEELPFFVSNDLALESQGDVIAADVAEWSRIVFQSYRNGNWEIYRASGNGSNQIRLTNHSASDIHPRLDRGCSRIAFASNRTGSYEIFVMNLDGSGLTQLTSNGTDDVCPSWSPDGMKIAFQSYRDGQAEIYIMNADGSNQTRLTSHGDYDGVPAWSPDGTQIAFVSRRTGGGRIWVMSSDGNGQTQLSTQPYSENPVWSPDGGQIAYDSDGDGDSWQELWVMDADGSDQRERYDPSESQTDAWVRSWSPDGRYVAFTRISFAYYQGNWYWTEAYLDAWDTEQAGSTSRLSSQGTDWHLDWQTTDMWAPTASISGLPQFLSIYDSTVHWAGHDVGSAGIGAYTIQYREEPEGEWTDWLYETPFSSDDFEGAIGQMHSFRVKARDNAFNESVWSPVQSTTMYARVLEGQLTDNREIPIVHGDIDVQPIPVTTIGTDFGGYYSAYLSAQGSHSLIPSQSGFGPAVTQTLDIHQDTSGILSVLPPADNVVVNGNFETGSLASWDLQGIYTVSVGSEGAHSGSHGLSEGRLISISDSISTTLPGDCVAVVQAPSGVLHAVSIDGEGLFYSASSDGTTWTNPEQITSGMAALYGHAPAIAVDSEGTIHVVFYVPGYAFHHVTKSVGGGWSIPQSISCTSADSRQPSIHVWDRTVHLLFPDYTEFGGFQIFHCSQLDDGTWSEAYQISHTRQHSQQWSGAIDQQGNLHVLWSGTGFESYADTGTAFVTRSTNGVWGTPIRLTTERSQDPYITVDADDNLYAMWHIIFASEAVELQKRPPEPSGSWSEPEVITSGWLSRPKLFISSNDTQYCVYYTSTGAYLLARRADGEAWTEPAHLGIVDQTLLVDDRVAFFSAADDISYRRVLPVVSDQTTSLSQSITLSSTMFSPTLSFLYRLRTLQNMASGGLIVRVADESRETTVWSSGTDTGLTWHHGWADLGDWLGQTITLTFVLSEVAGTDSLHLDLDEITVGSWNTPVIESIEPPQVEADTPFTLNIQGRNFRREGTDSSYILPRVLLGDSWYTGTIWINSSTLSLSSDGMPVGIYSIAVANPDGQTGSGPATLQVGHFIWLSLAARNFQH